MRTHCNIQLRGSLCPLRDLPSLNGSLRKNLLVRICTCGHMPAHLRPGGHMCYYVGCIKQH